jgi:hypothetical protein
MTVGEAIGLVVLVGLGAAALWGLGRRWRQAWHDGKTPPGEAGD